MVMAVSQLRNSEYISTQNSDPANSPVESGDRPMGAKASTAMKVAPSNGHMVCLTIALAASSLVWPRCRPIKMPSVMTIALSTSMPRAMISAPSEMRWSSMSFCSIRMNVPLQVRNSTIPISTPLLMPMKNNSTTMTMATAAIRFFRKLATEISTSLGWL